MPGGIYSDLLNAGILKSDIYYRFNENEYKWVAESNWTFEATFNLDEIPQTPVILDCQGTVIQIQNICSYIRL